MKTHSGFILLPPLSPSTHQTVW